MTAIYPQGEFFTNAELLKLCFDGSPIESAIEGQQSTDSFLDRLFRPAGIKEIIFHKTSSTHINFRWRRNCKATIVINQDEWDSLNGALRYFVLTHEVGHLKKLPIGKVKITQDDETQADLFAFEECHKAGFHFSSIQQIRELYQSSIL